MIASVIIAAVLSLSGIILKIKAQEKSGFWGMVWLFVIHTCLIVLFVGWNLPSNPPIQNQSELKKEDVEKIVKEATHQTSLPLIKEIAILKMEIYELQHEVEWTRKDVRLAAGK